MNWITNFVRPKIRALVQADTPDDLWVKSPATGQMIFKKDLEKNMWVCPYSGHHMRISARKRLETLFDDGEFATVELPKTPVDPLKFKDLKRYVDRVKDADAKNEDKEAIIVAHGSMGGSPVVIAAFNFSYMGGSMGTAVGEGLLTAAKLAVVQQAPLLVIPASGGARMQQGILSLMQMPRSIIAVDMVKEAGLPYVVLLTDPTTGGVSASFAMLGDLQIAEPGAMIGFAGKRVIEETIREQLPEGFQTAEYLLEHGMLDMVVHRHEMRDTLIRVFGLLMHKDPAAPVVPLVEKKAEAPAVEEPVKSEAPEGLPID
ncbi:acetyl-CoA carboxylase, carboxyltransferase subunit beta [Kiloniella sp. b19]|uniref:acetyl-CoA carboxylase, carboxyltransferase subunit beta n=1 Tax=Kiloniella sp. GXU_MW_B19 TaxID=3141326 RepID=UPI0031D800A6